MAVNSRASPCDEPDETSALLPCGSTRPPRCVARARLSPSWLGSCAVAEAGTCADSSSTPSGDDVGGCDDPPPARAPAGLLSEAPATVSAGTEGGAEDEAGAPWAAVAPVGAAPLDVVPLDGAVQVPPPGSAPAGLGRAGVEVRGAVKAAEGEELLG